ncbi:MAG: hypothetical protein IJ424_08825 [Oscillospiraceae bacterium]|nr:hypothetical protein [Oscillospiraceae bacterium]
MKGSIKMQAALRQLKKAGRALKQEYFLLCRKDNLTACQRLFTYLYPDISRDIAELTVLKEDLPQDMSLAQEIISHSGSCFESTEKIIMIISGVMAQRRVTSIEIDTLKNALLVELITSICNTLKSNEEADSLSLYQSVKQIDFNAVTSSCDPLHNYLTENDETYCESDLKTQRQYRRIIYRTAPNDEVEAAKELLEHAKMHALDLSEVLLPTYHRTAAKAIILAVCYLSIAVSLSAGFSLLTLEWWVAPMLFLPSLCAAKAIVDSVVLWGQKPNYLWRLSETSDKVKSEKLAIVCYTMLSESVDISRISDRLKKLSSTVSGLDAKVVCLIDLLPEQAPTIPDDTPTLNSAQEMITSLNESEKGRYVGIIRKRSFSKSQEEYMGAGGKRGALFELSSFLQNGAHDFYAIFGDSESLIGTRFMAIMDNNCTPELDAVGTLLQIAMHPCNLPRVKDGKIIKGFGIIVPNTGPKLESALASGFSRVFSVKSEREDVFSELFGMATFNGIGLINTELYYNELSASTLEKAHTAEALDGESLKCVKAADAMFYDTFPDIPQRFYRKKITQVRGAVYNLGHAFRRQVCLASRMKIIGSFLNALLPLSLMANMYFVFFLYPPTAEFAALLGIVMWLLPLALTALKSKLWANSAWGIKNAVYSIVMLPTLAQKSLWAISSALVRGLTRKRLLSENLTASDPLSFYIAPMLISLILFRSPGYTIRLFALFFALMPAVLALSEHEVSKKEHRLSFKETKDLLQYAKDSWKFFNEYVTEADNNLPPKSVQFSPVYRISHSTGPAEIGLYLISCLSAYDLKLITAQAMASRVETCLDSVDRLDKFDGCLFESYSTLTLTAESSVALSEDMGIYVTSLVCLSEGLRKLGKVYDKAQILAERLDRMIDLIDLSVFYDGVSGLMCKSFDCQTLTSGCEHHQHLMSASRLCSFYAVASKNVPKSHWQSLRRETLKCGFYSGLGSPHGSAEEFFLPEIFIKSPQGSIFYESLKFALYVSKKLGISKGLPFGLSKSGVCLFDSGLNYRTQNLGAAKAAISPTNTSIYSVSPHSAMLALDFGTHACTENLLKLKKAGAYGNFGFFEAVDYTSNDNQSVVKLLASRHVGQMIASCSNALNKGILQRRTAKNKHILGALELLEERSLPVYKALRKPKALYVCESLAKEKFLSVSASDPKIKLLSNDGYSLALTDSGVSIALSHGMSIYEITREPSFNKRGIFMGVKTQSNLIMLDMPDRMQGEFTDCGASYKKCDSEISASVNIMLHPSLSCEIRQFKLKNLTNIDIDLTLLIYLEPTLLKPYEDNTQRNRLSLRLERDDKQRVITVSRADNNCSQVLAIGFLNDTFAYSSFDKENVFSGCDDVKDVFNNCDSIAPSLVSEPEPCVFIKQKIHLNAGAEQIESLFILCADSMDKLSADINTLRGRSLTPHIQKSTKELVLAQIIAPSILFGRHEPIDTSFASDIGLLPNIPLIILRLNNKNDDEKLYAFLGAYKVLREAGISVQMAVIFNDSGRPERIFYSKLLEASKQCDTLGFIYTKGGIIPIDEFAFNVKTVNDIYRLAAYTASDEIISNPPDSQPYERIEIKKVSPQAQTVEEAVSCGGFMNTEYIINERPQAKWQHVLSNPVFGAVVENASLGKTSFGNFNERLVLEYDGSYYDIINGAAACFSPDFASYKAFGEGFKSEVKVSVSKKGMCKQSKVKIIADRKCRLAYLFQAKGARLINQSGYAALFDLKKRLASISADKLPHFIFDKEAFFAGRWQSQPVSGNIDFCALVLELSGAEEVSFYLSFGASEKAVTKMPSLFCTSKKAEAKTKHERELLWAKYQLLNGRIYLGDGEGCYKFDELLQDACAIADVFPARGKAEILRCAYHQFSDGDACAEFSKQSAFNKNKRTKSSLAHLWLPLAVSEYIKQTDDFRFLDIAVNYCDLPSQKESVYEHCRRAIDISIDKKGSHGLMLDSHERESVWLSEFFIIVLDSFCEISRRKGDNIYSAQLMHTAKSLRDTVKAYCRDSSQYIGGYLPSGKTWGSTKNDACKISLLPQVLALFAGLDAHFDKGALLQAYSMLCDPKRGVTKLFSPPFDPDSEESPDEVRYLPQGIKQNGGQNTAAAIWFANALKQAGLLPEADSIFNALKPEEVAKTPGYKQEPYYICGEIYTNKNCYGRGGDPIFNTAAGWYYRRLASSQNSGPQA